VLLPPQLELEEYLHLISFFWQVNLSSFNVYKYVREWPSGIPLCITCLITVYALLVWYLLMENAINFFSGWSLETFTTLDIWCTGPLWRSALSVTARNTKQKITRYNWRWRIVWIKVSTEAHLRCLHVKHYQKVFLYWLLELWITNISQSGALYQQPNKINILLCHFPAILKQMLWNSVASTCPS